MRNKILKGDCIEELTKLGSETVDLVVTDPPYGIDLTPTRKTSKFAGVKIENDAELDWVDDFYRELYRVSKNVSYIFCGWSTIDVFMSKAKKAGFEVKNLIVWDKMHFGLGYNYRPQHELIMLLVKDKFKTKSNNLSNILRFKRLHHTKMSHVAEKPVDLLKLLIEESTEEGDVVLDCFCGSGSTLEAAYLLKRDYIGIEIDEGYHKGACDRLAELEKYASSKGEEES